MGTTGRSSDTAEGAGSEDQPRNQANMWEFELLDGYMRLSIETDAGSNHFLFPRAMYMLFAASVDRSLKLTPALPFHRSTPAAELAGR